MMIAANFESSSSSLTSFIAMTMPVPAAGFALVGLASSSKFFRDGEPGAALLPARPCPGFLIRGLLCLTLYTVP
jgi:hypothetical protein